MTSTPGAAGRLGRGVRWGTRRTLGLLSVLVVIVIATVFTWKPKQQFAQLGDLRLQSGDVIHDAVIGYRTAGRLNQSRSNGVLVAPWFQGTTSQLAQQIGPGKLVDTSKYFVILVDALGNGVSSSPSNSRAQPEDRFPIFTIRDVVESQHRLVTRALGLTHLHAVVGISMGGMQVFEWAVAYPDFIDKAVAIVGSPRTQPDDRERSNGIIEWVRKPVAERTWGALRRWMPRTAVHELLIEPHNQIRQAQSMITHDISQPFGGLMERAAEGIRADLLIVSTWQDRDVNPAPAFELARLAGAEVLELDGRCGHQAPSCERATLWPTVSRFLAG